MAIGAEVILEGGKVPRTRRVRRDGSYASSSDPRIVLAAVPDAPVVRVRWPDGTEREFRDLALNRYHTVHP